MKRSIIAGLVLAGLLTGGAVAVGSAQDAGRSTVADTSWGGWVCPPNATTDICAGRHHFPRLPGTGTAAGAVELTQASGNGRPIGTTDTSWGG